MSCSMMASPSINLRLHKVVYFFVLLVKQEIEHLAVSL